MRCPTLRELPEPPAGKTGWPWTEETPEPPGFTSSGLPWPKISIVTPSYNQGQFLEETIRSVLLQGYSDIEYIIIDGGSRDHSVTIIEEYQDKIAYWISGRDSGQSEAINKGLRRASGELIGWLNSDDLLESGALHKVAACYLSERKREKVLISGAALLFDEAGRTCKWTPRKISKGALLNQHRIADTPFFVIPCQPATFFTRRAQEEIGWINENLHYAMDYEFWLRMIGKRVKIVYSSDVLARYRFHGDSKSTTAVGLFPEEWKSVSEQARRTSLDMAWSYMSWWTLHWPRIKATCLKTNELESLRVMSERRLGTRKRVAAMARLVLRNPFVLFNRMFLGAVKRLVAQQRRSAN